MKKTVFKTFVVSFFAIVVFSIVVLQILASPASSAHSNSSISSSEFLGVESFSGLTAASVSVVQESTICDGDFWAEDTNTLLTLLEESSASDYVDLARANLSVGLPTAFFFKDQNYQDDVWVFVVGEFLDEDQVDIAGNDGWGDDVHSIIFFEPTLEGANWILDIFDRKNLEPQDGTVRFCSSIAIPDLDEKMYSRVADMKGDDMSSFRFLFSSEDCAPFCLVTPTPQPTPYAVQGCDDGPSSEQITLHRNINFAGGCSTLGVGSHPLVSDLLVPNDTVSSIRVGDDVVAYLCRHIHMGGICEAFLSDDESLVDNRVGNDHVSSVRVVPKTQESESCDGDIWSVSRSDALDLLERSSASAYSDLVRTSLDLGVPMLVLFKDQDYRGDIWLFAYGEYRNENQLDLVGNDGWGDDVHSLLYFPPPLGEVDWMLDIYDHSDLNPKDGTLRFCSTSAIPDLDDDIFKDFADMKGDDMSSFRSYADGEDLITCGGYKVIDSTYTIVSTSPERPECFHWIKMNAGEEVTLSIGQGTTRHGSRPDSERLSFSLWNPNGELIAEGQTSFKFIPDFTGYYIVHSSYPEGVFASGRTWFGAYPPTPTPTPLPSSPVVYEFEYTESSQGSLYVTLSWEFSCERCQKREIEAVDCGWLRNCGQKEEGIPSSGSMDFLRIRNNAQPYAIDDSTFRITLENASGEYEEEIIVPKTWNPEEPGDPNSPGPRSASINIPYNSYCHFEQGSRSGRYVAGNITEIRNDSSQSIHIYRPVGEHEFPEPGGEMYLSSNETVQVNWSSRDILNLWGADITSKTNCNSNDRVQITILYEPTLDANFSYLPIVTAP